MVDLPETRIGKLVAGGVSSWVIAPPAPFWRFLYFLGAARVVCWGVDWEEVVPPKAKVTGNQWSNAMERFFTIFIVGSSYIGVVSSAAGPSSSGSPKGGASTGICPTWPWKTLSAEPSWMGSKESYLNSQGPKCLASPKVRHLGGKPGSRMSKYGSKGLSTVKAYNESW